MSLVDYKPGYVADGLRIIRSYLEQVRINIEKYRDAPIGAFDSDAISQLITPHYRRSNLAGLLWHTAITARELGDAEPTPGMQTIGSKRTLRRIQIPYGAKREITMFCRKLIREYSDLLSGPEASKLGIDPSDVNSVLHGDIPSDEELSRFIQKAEKLDTSLKLLATFLSDYAEFTRLPSPPAAEDKFKTYLAKIVTERPQLRKFTNNANDAVNLAQASELRAKGYNAYVVTTTRAVQESGGDNAQDPFYFALELAIRKRFVHLTATAASQRIGMMISRLDEAIIHTNGYKQVLESPRSTHSRPKELLLLRDALQKLGNDAELREVTSFLSDAASAMKIAHDAAIGDSGRSSSDSWDFSQLQSLLNRLRNQLDDVPKVSLRRTKQSSEHFSYSLLDPHGDMLFAADLHADELAVAWPTEVSLWQFCDQVTTFCTESKEADHIELVVRLAGDCEPRFLTTNLHTLKLYLADQIQTVKPSLIKVLSSGATFWYDASRLFAFERPEDVKAPEPSRIAVSLRNKDTLSHLIDFYLASAIKPPSRADTEHNLKKLLGLER